MMMLIDPAEQNIRPHSVGVLWIAVAVLTLLLSFSIIDKEQSMRAAYQVMFDEYKNWVAYVDTPEQAAILEAFRFCYVDNMEAAINNSKNYESRMMLGSKANPYKFFELANEVKNTCLNVLEQDATSLAAKDPQYLEQFKIFKQELSHRYRWQI